jgi:hypothetical protein
MRITSSYNHHGSGLNLVKADKFELNTKFKTACPVRTFENQMKIKENSKSKIPSKSLQSWNNLI